MLTVTRSKYPELPSVHQYRRRLLHRLPDGVIPHDLFLSDAGLEPAHTDTHVAIFGSEFEPTPLSTLVAERIRVLEAVYSDTDTSTDINYTIRVYVDQHGPLIGHLMLHPEITTMPVKYNPMHTTVVCEDTIQWPSPAIYEKWRADNAHTWARVFKLIMACVPRDPSDTGRSSTSLDTLVDHPEREMFLDDIVRCGVLGNYRHATSATPLRFRHHISGEATVIRVVTTAPHVANLLMKEYIVAYTSRDPVLSRVANLVMRWSDFHGNIVRMCNTVVRAAVNPVWVPAHAVKRVYRQHLYHPLNSLVWDLYTAIERKARTVLKDKRHGVAAAVPADAGVFVNMAHGLHQVIDLGVLKGLGMSAGGTDLLNDLQTQFRRTKSHTTIHATINAMSTADIEILVGYMDVVEAESRPVMIHLNAYTTRLQRSLKPRPVFYCATCRQIASPVMKATPSKRGARVVIDACAGGMPVCEACGDALAELDMTGLMVVDRRTATMLCCGCGSPNAVHQMINVGQRALCKYCVDRTKRTKCCYYGEALRATDEQFPFVAQLDVPDENDARLVGLVSCAYHKNPEFFAEGPVITMARVRAIAAGFTPRLKMRR